MHNICKVRGSNPDHHKKKGKVITTKETYKTPTKKKNCKTKKLLISSK